MLEPLPLFGYCAAGHGWSEVKDHDGLLLCVRKCYPRKERMAAQIRGIIERRQRCQQQSSKQPRRTSAT